MFSVVTSTLLNLVNVKITTGAGESCSNTVPMIAGNLAEFYMHGPILARNF